MAPKRLRFVRNKKCLWLSSSEIPKAEAYVRIVAGALLRVLLREIRLHMDCIGIDWKENL